LFRYLVYKDFELTINGSTIKFKSDGVLELKGGRHIWVHSNDLTFIGKHGERLIAERSLGEEHFEKYIQQPVKFTTKKGREGIDVRQSKSSETW
jgi:hypothetical protein